ncbi:DUF3052 domain-containing protein [Flagellimonas meishanensis]|uniref:DUF3052 domain-containing protein n=1 Tax=Flagellimonas meishanensis TaxID=2873264 RepID=UPI001CA6E410|nr:DUF3052 domain-containing protein [[Muricauda] meishanensis]
MKPTSGYSKTPLAKKLGIKEGFSILLYNPPNHYWKLFSDLPPNLHIKNNLGDELVDFIHIFCTSEKELHKNATHYKKALKKDGMLWVSWPKGSSSINTDLKREPVREHLLAIGLVDIKVAAVDDDWSGLKFVYRVKDRG